MTAAPDRRPGLIASLMVPLVPFVAISLAAPAYSNESGTDWIWLWQAFVLWPIGAVLMIVPVLGLRAVRSRSIHIFGLIGVALLGVASAVLVARDSHSTAALNYLYVLVGGPAVAWVTLGLDNWLSARRGGRKPPTHAEASG